MRRLLLLWMLSSCSTPVDAGAGADAGVSRTASDPTALTRAPAAAIRITEVAAFQTIKIALAKDGEAVTSDVPLVPHKDTLFRAYVAPEEGFEKRELLGQLRVTVPTTTGERRVLLEDQKVIAKASYEGDLTSTFNFTVPESLVGPGAEVAFLVSEVGAENAGQASDSPARFPKSGALPLTLTENVEQLRITLVPVRYNADRSGRLPDVSGEAVQKFSEGMAARFPASKVHISVHEPLDWKETIASSGNGFSELLDAVEALHASDRAATREYYYGIVNPKSSLEEFCVPSCTSGLSVRGRPYSVGLGYLEQESAVETMAHEVGHAHGLSHAPCGGADSPDPKFPYKSGSTGVWGYNILRKRMLDPQSTTDMMGYCRFPWLSDYTYGLLFERVTADNKRDKGLLRSEPVRRRVFNVAPNGTATFAGFAWVDMDDPMGEEVSFVEAVQDQKRVGRARLFSYDHQGGGKLFLDASPASRVRLSIPGMAAPIEITVPR